MTARPRSAHEPARPALPTAARPAPASLYVMTGYAEHPLLGQFVDEIV